MQLSVTKQISVFSKSSNCYFNEMFFLLWYCSSYRFTFSFEEKKTWHTWGDVSPDEGCRQNSHKHSSHFLFSHKHSLQHLLVIVHTPHLVALLPPFTGTWKSPPSSFTPIITFIFFSLCCSHNLTIYFCPVLHCETLPTYSNLFYVNPVIALLISFSLFKMAFTNIT